MEAAMLQCLQANEALADDGDILPFFGVPGRPQRHPQARVPKGTGPMWSLMLHQMAPVTRMLPTMTSSPFVEVHSVPHASTWFVSGATHVWCATHAFAQLRVLVRRWW